MEQDDERFIIAYDRVENAKKTVERNTEEDRGWQVQTRDRQGG